MQWEILEAKHNLDMLKAEKAKYEVKLEELYVQSQVIFTGVHTVYFNRCIPCGSDMNQ